MALIMMCSELVVDSFSIPLVFSDTGIELQATKDFVLWCKENYYHNIQIIKPKMSFDKVIKTYGKPGTSKVKCRLLEDYQRHKHQFANKTKLNAMSELLFGVGLSGSNVNSFKLSNQVSHFLHKDFDIKLSPKCCDKLKKEPFKRYAKENKMLGAMDGRRSNEGGQRKIVANKSKTPCTSIKKDGFINKYPIIDWTQEDIDLFIDLYSIPLSRAYTKYGMKRTGCMACPFSPNIDKDLEALYKYEPLKYKASMFWLKDVYIAQGVKVPFDKEYEVARKVAWVDRYDKMNKEVNNIKLKYRKSIHFKK